MHLDRKSVRAIRSITTWAMGITNKFVKHIVRNGIAHHIHIILCARRFGKRDWRGCLARESGPDTFLWTQKNPPYRWWMARTRTWHLRYQSESANIQLKGRYNIIMRQIDGWMLGWYRHQSGGRMVDGHQHPPGKYRKVNMDNGREPRESSRITGNQPTQVR